MKIDKDIPIPESTAKSYPFKDMEVGDSIMIENAVMGGKEYSQARMHGHRNDKKFTARVVEGGIRIWRVE